LSIVQPTGVPHESSPKLLLFLSILVKSDTKDAKVIRQRPRP